MARGSDQTLLFLVLALAISSVVLALASSLARSLFGLPLVNLAHGESEWRIRVDLFTESDLILRVGLCIYRYEYAYICRCQISDVRCQISDCTVVSNTLYSRRVLYKVWGHSNAREAASTVPVRLG